MTAERPATGTGATPVATWTTFEKAHLFAGKPGFLGGLSNERELVRHCPADFKRGNKWTKAASTIFFRGADPSKWAWRTTDRGERQKQLACLRGALMGFDLKHEDKEAICGWMLSEMLTEVPA